MTMLDAINDALVEIARRDPGFFVYGQDVGSPRGGVFGATQSLVNEFPWMAISSPLNEQLILVWLYQLKRGRLKKRGGCAIIVE